MLPYNKRKLHFGGTPGITSRIPRRPRGIFNNQGVVSCFRRCHQQRQPQSQRQSQWRFRCRDHVIEEEFWWYVIKFCSFRARLPPDVWLYRTGLSQMENPRIRSNNTPANSKSSILRTCSNSVICGDLIKRTEIYWESTENVLSYFSSLPQVSPYV